VSRALLDELRVAAGRERPGMRFCTAAVANLGVAGAAIMLASDGAQATSMGCSDGVAGALEDLQFTVGEGPGFDAHRGGHPVLVPALAGPAAPWPLFGPGAIGLGTAAAFGFPLRIGAVRLGALDLYATHPGDLTAGQTSDALLVARVVTEAVLALQAGASPERLPEAVDDAERLRAEVHQAAGMLSEQLGLSVTDALVRLRAYAYAEDRPIVGVAHEVVQRWLRIE